MRGIKNERKEGAALMRGKEIKTTLHPDATSPTSLSLFLFFYSTNLPVVRIAVVKRLSPS